MTEITSETVLRLKQLELKFENLEADVKMTDCCFNELEADQEEAGNKIDILEKRVTHLEWDLEPHISRLDIFKRTSQLEESIEVLKVQNVELRNHVNLLVDTVNNITRLLNSNIEQADEGVDQVDGIQSNEEPEENEPSQLTVEQANSMKTPFFHDMDLSQPKDEEGGQEMEHEVSLKEQQERVNGLTQDEWKDLLRI